MGAEGRGQHRVSPRAAAADPDAVRRRAKTDEFLGALLASPFIAAEHGFLDDVIEPRETRPRA